MKIMVSCEHSCDFIPQEWSQLFVDKKLKMSEYGVGHIYNKIAPQIADYCDATNVSMQLVDTDGSISFGTALSDITSELSAQDAGKIIRDYYLPYQIEFEDRAEQWRQVGERVLMLGLHTFEPIVNNIPIGMDIGLIFNHNQTEERSLALRLKRGFEKSAPWLRVRFNTPLKVKEDGFVQHMRDMYGTILLGLEIYVGENVIFPEGIRVVSEVVTDVISKWRDEFSNIN